MNHADLFSKISKTFEGQFSFILIGGFAVNAYKFSRQTLDIDFMIVDRDFEVAEKKLQSMGYAIFEKTDSFARFKDTTADHMMIDLLFVDEATMNAIEKNAQTTTIANIKFRIPSLNHLIALKLHALKNNFRHRVGKDLGDILQLVDIHKIDVKSEAFKTLCLRYGTEDLYRMLVESK